MSLQGGTIYIFVIFIVVSFFLTFFATSSGRGDDRVLCNPEERILGAVFKRSPRQWILLAGYSSVKLQRPMIFLIFFVSGW